MKTSEEKLRTVLIGTRGRKRRIAVLISVLVCVPVLAALAFNLVLHFTMLRSFMERSHTDALTHTLNGSYHAALADAEEARALALRLRDKDAVYEIDELISFIETVLHANELFETKR